MGVFTENRVEGKRGENTHFNNYKTVLSLQRSL